MDEVRCINCNKLLLKVPEKKAYWIEIKCPKCKRLQTQGRSKWIDFKNTKKESVENALLNRKTDERNDTESI